MASWGRAEWARLAAFLPRLLGNRGVAGFLCSGFIGTPQTEQDLVNSVSPDPFCFGDGSSVRAAKARERGQNRPRGVVHLSFGADVACRFRSYCKARSWESRISCSQVSRPNRILSEGCAG